MATISKKSILDRVERAIRLTLVDETGSTNDDLKQAAKAGEKDYTVLIAERQTVGRGREGRSFSSPSGLYMSLILPWREDSCRYVTHIAAVAVARAIKSATQADAKIKWVNDVFVDGKKVCGILTESVLCGETRRLVLGIGVNVNTPEIDFPQELKKIAGRVSCDKSDLAAEILREFLSRFDVFSAERLRAEYCALCFLIDKRVTVPKGDAAQEATVVGLDDDLGLIVRYDDGTHERLISGEVRISLLP